MNDAPKKRASWKRASIAVAALVTLYVLSIGPTELLVLGGYWTGETYRTIYAPVLWLARNSAWVDALVVFYMRLWLS
jgi:hypothetical protein